MTMIDAARLRATDPARLRATGAAGQSGTRQAGGAFLVAEAAESGAAEAAAPLADAAPVSLGVMLAAEALDHEATRDQAARRQGQVVLVGLTALQRALLAATRRLHSTDSPRWSPTCRLRSSRGLPRCWTRSCCAPGSNWPGWSMQVRRRSGQNSFMSAV